MTYPAPVTTEQSVVQNLPRFTPPPKPPSTKRTFYYYAVAIIIILAIVLFIVLRRHSHGTPTRTVAASPTIPFERTLRLKGTTRAVESRTILAPHLAGQQISVLVITKLAEAGTRVSKGDLLVEFDRQGEIKNLLDRKAELSGLETQVAQERAKEDAARAADETELKLAETAFRKAQLEIQKIEILSRVDAEKARETLEETKATAQQLKETFDLKRQAARASIRILEIQRDRSRQSMQHSQKNAELLQVRSPLDGIVVLNTIWKQGTMGIVAEGDQVPPGTPFMQVVDPSVMQVSVQANQQDFRDLEIGQKAQVSLDAYPELSFTGKLQEMAPVASPGSFSDSIRSFGVVFSIEGNDPRLMPDLSAAVDVELKSNPGNTTGTAR